MHKQKGGVVSTSCIRLVKTVWRWAKVERIWLPPSHVSGIKSTIADLRLRVFMIVRGGQFSEVFTSSYIDLFASRLNA